MTSQIAGKMHAVEAVEAAVQAQLDRAARDVADVGLVVRVAVDDLEVVARAHQADGQHALRVQQLARHVDRHVADREPAGARLPRAHGRRAGSRDRAPRRARPARRRSEVALMSSSRPAAASRGTPCSPSTASCGRHELVEVERLELRQLGREARGRRSARDGRARRSAGSRPTAAAGACAPRRARPRPGRRRRARRRGPIRQRLVAARRCGR